ncbi:MAG: 3-dehydroquinate synthase [FCB group bacterium]|nr:3-dehydroquinate synthase [FCB group bacterium]
MFEGVNSVSRSRLEPVEVELGKSSYSVYFNDNWFELSRKYAGLRPVIISDRNVGSLYMSKWKAVFPDAETLVIPPGEKSKSAGTMEQIYSFLITKKFNRDTLVIALGGGVIGDAAGFAAATYMRGVEYIQIPTSLLAMVDSSVGGKVGINHRLGKNLIGTFKQPLSVFVDFDHLATLPQREMRCGMGEMIKYALIDKSLGLKSVTELLTCCDDRKWEPLTDKIRTCVEIKAKIVAEDETDVLDKRIVLNFGHTIAHALEAVSDYRVYRHGEAVVAGIIGASFMSYKRDLIDGELFKEILGIMGKFPLPSLGTTINSAAMAESMITDKKAREGKIRYVLLKDRDKVEIAEDVSREEIMAGIEFIKSFLVAKTAEG